MENAIINLFGKLEIWETAIITVVVSGIATLAMLAVRQVVNLFTTWWSCKTKTYVIKVKTRLPEQFGTRVKFRCLLIRYGTDAYIERMASDLDRRNGQLQNKVIEIAVQSTEDGISEFTLNLPVHSRLGTQSKCFADISASSNPNDTTADQITQEVKNFLEQTSKVEDISASSSEYQHRVYFLLKRFAVVESVEGFKNNHCFPE